ncbi:hypothetical protein GCM10009016_06530 [Halomonas beimenensis]
METARITEEAPANGRWAVTLPTAAIFRWVPSEGAYAHFLHIGAGGRTPTKHRRNDAMGRIL